MDNHISSRTPAFKEVIKELDGLLRQLDLISSEIRPRVSDTQYLTGEEVRLTYNLSPRCLQKYRDEGIIPFVQIGRKILYPQDEIENMLRRNYSR